MAYIGWPKMTKPKGLGRLGFTDLETINSVLLMKFLWRLAAGSEALWAQIVRAKYLPRSELWWSKREYTCTPFWKALMRLREQLLPMLSWQLGNGENCKAMAQPWFQGAIACQLQSDTDRNLMVKDLLVQGTGQWDVNRLIFLFGYVNTMNILQEIEPPNLNAGPGKLVFKHSTNSIYSVKKAYGLLTINQQQWDTDLTGVWEAIWHKGDVAPRIRVFMWKLMHDGLPLAATLNRRFSNISTACAICGDTDENVSHVTHKCQFARACHFAGPIALRTDTLPQSFPDAVEYLIGLMDDLQWTRYANSLWALWRCRNDVAYGSKAVDLHDFNNYLSTVMWESHLMASQGSKIRITEVQAIDLNIQDFEYCCNVDGSWLKEWEGGIGVFLKRNEELIMYKSAKVRGCCSMQLEARALWEAVKLVTEMGISNCIFLSDNKTLVELVSQNSPPSNADWRAYSEILSVWESLSKNATLACKHIPRDQNSTADALAKLGRKQGWDFTGSTYPILEGM